MNLRAMLTANSKSVNWLAWCAAATALFAACPVQGQTVPAAAQAQAAPARQPETPTASQRYDQGLAAERAGDWEKALVAYAGALALSPTDAAVRTRLEIARFQVVQERTERAERELLADRKDAAIATLHSALQLDPTYSVARERLEQIEQQPTFAGDLPPLPRASGPPSVAAEPGLRKFDYRGRSRGAYEEVARQFGLVASFDSDLTERDVRFRVDAVDFPTAMDLLGQITDTFWISIDARTFFVASDSADKRNQYAPEITVSLPLPAAESLDDMTETTRVVRDITGVRRSTLNAGAHTLELRDTPDNVDLARELLSDIDQPRGEVLLDINILEVDRNAAERIGITPPSQGKTFTLSSGQVQQLQNAQNNGTLLQVLQGIFGPLNPLASGTNLAALLPPLLVFGGGKSTFLATLPGATADFSRTLSVVRQAQRVLLRVKDGQPGTLFVGERFPVSLAVLSQSLVSGQSQFSPGLSAGTFPRTDFATGTSPSSVVTGDFNGDGKLDLAVANQAADTVSILLGDGNGGFGSHTDFATAAGPVALTTIDFDRDGKLDLAVADNSAGVVSLLRGNGDGTFAAPISLPAGNGPSAILSKDFNKDGIDDLVVANSTDNTVSVYLGNGDGTFAARQSFIVGAGPVALAAADFDNDGNLDLAVANQAANTASVLKGAGDGTFTTRTDLNTGKGPGSLNTADFNNDGRPDLVVANQTDNTVSVFTGDGNGGFTTQTNLTTGGSPTAVLAADLNADQVPDFVTANQQDNTVSVFLSLGNGSFAPPLVLPTGNAPVALAAADLNGDGRLDLVTGNRASNSVSVTLNTTNVPVSPNAPLTAYPASQYVDLGLKVSATPRIHPGQEVTLRLQFEISSLSGSDVNGIPIIGSRVVDQMVRLSENETSVLSGMFESNDLLGTTGANPLGLLSGNLAARNTAKSETETLITITPVQISVGPHAGRTLYAGRGEGPTAPAPTPAPLQPGGETNVAPQPGAPSGVIPPGTPPAPGPGQIPPQQNAPPDNSPDNQAPFVPPPPPINAPQGPG